MKPVVIRRKEKARLYLTVDKFRFLDLRIGKDVFDLRVDCPDALDMVRRPHVLVCLDTGRQLIWPSPHKGRQP